MIIHHSSNKMMGKADPRLPPQRLFMFLHIPVSRFKSLLCSVIRGVEQPSEGNDTLPE